jgi:hypothetical protein
MCIDVSVTPDGHVVFRNTATVRQPIPVTMGRCHATRAEWDAFVAGIKAGDFDRLYEDSET